MYLNFFFCFYLFLMTIWDLFFRKTIFHWLKESPRKMYRIESEDYSTMHNAHAQPNAHTYITIRMDAPNHSSKWISKLNNSRKRAHLIELLEMLRLLQLHCTALHVPEIGQHFIHCVSNCFANIKIKTKLIEMILFLIYYSRWQTLFPLLLCILIVYTKFSTVKREKALFKSEKFLWFYSIHMMRE